MELGQGMIAETSDFTVPETGSTFSKKVLSGLEGQEVKEAKYDKKRLALGRIISSARKTSMIEILHGKKGLHATELFRDSGISSEGTFYYHLRDLEWLGVIEQRNKIYTLTEFGGEIANSLSKLP